MNSVTKALLIIYVLVLCWILLLKLGVNFSYMSKRNVNLIPFSGHVDNVQAILNVIIMLPLGLYVGALFCKWSLPKNILFVFLVSFLFEALQYIFRIGAFDMTDIATNTTGGFIGLLLYKLIEKIVGSQSKAQRFVNITGLLGTVTMITLLILLKLNMLPIRYQ